MAGKPVCRLCDRLVIGLAATFTSGSLAVSLPAGSCRNGRKHRIVTGQALSAADAINAPVFVSTGTGREHCHNGGPHGTAAGKANAAAWISVPIWLRPSRTARASSLTSWPGTAGISWSTEKRGRVPLFSCVNTCVKTVYLFADGPHKSKRFLYGRIS